MECDRQQPETADTVLALTFQSNDDRSQWPGQVMGMADQVKGLKTVGEWDPH